MTEFEFLPSRILVVTGVYGSAIFPMLWAALAASAGRVFGGWLVYLMAVAALTAFLSFFQGFFANEADLSRAGTAALMVFAFAWMTLRLPFLLMLTTGWRVWRGVAPIIFSGLLLFGLAPFAGYHLGNLLSQTNTGGNLLLASSKWVGLHGVFLALSLPAGYLAWRRIRSLALAYERKEFSDAQLLIRGWWLMFILTFAQRLVGQVDKSLIVIAGAIAAYWGFLKLSASLLKRSHLNEARETPRSLLLLRVFGFRRRTEKLFDRLMGRWRLFGPIYMIAGVDLAGRTIDPGDFLRYMTGRLEDYFVKGAEDLTHKLDSLDRAPDPDGGRYRVTEFFCHKNTWQASLVGLLQHSDIVLMDLRGFSEQKKGCEFELQQIAARLPLERVLVVVDSATDLALLERSLAGGSGTLRLARMEKQSSREIERLFLALLDMPSGPAPAPAIANS